MSKLDVIVKLDDRVRLLSAVIAATNYPEYAQKIKPHGTHAHARATLKYVADYSDHPAVKSTQSLLDNDTPLEALFALVMLMKWSDMSIAALPPWAPKDYNKQLADFYKKTKLADFWKQENARWEKAKTEATHVFDGKVEFKEFLAPFLGKVDKTLVFMPNISYPANHNLGFSLGDELICIAPPPLAWGESPPWPYDEPTMITHSYKTALLSYASVLLKAYLDAHETELAEISKEDLPLHEQFIAQYPTWREQFSTLFLSGIIAMYLEGHVDDKEYKAYMLMEKKASGLVNLPGTVSVMRRYLQEVGGDKYNNLIEFLPIFPKQLRVAQKIVRF
jgi:hypothetical protein